MNNYQTYCKPTLSKALHSVGLDLTFHRANKQYIYYRDDRNQECKVLDLLGGYGAVILGHNPPILLKTLTQQIEQGVVFHNQFSLRAGAADLAVRLNPILRKETGWEEKFLCAFTSTGAESVEVAVKHAEVVRGRQLDELDTRLKRSAERIKIGEDVSWEINSELCLAHPELNEASYQKKVDTINSWNEKKLNQPPIFIALKHAFHGKLNTSIQLTYGEMYRHPFRRFGLNTLFFSPAELTAENIQRLKNEEQAYLLEMKVRRGKVSIHKVNLPLVAAILVEPAQGEGGVYFLKEDDVQALHQARTLLSCPLVADEVQSGCGRCGTFLAGSQIGLKPDYVVLSKGLGGGISKIGVVAIRESKYAEGFDLIQSSTFGEDDWSARVADEFIRQLTKDDALLEKVRERGAALGEALQQLQVRYPDIIKEVRGKGLLYGIEFNDQSDALSILINPALIKNPLLFDSRASAG